MLLAHDDLKPKNWHFNSEIIKTVPLKRKSKKITIIFEQFNYLHTHTRGNRNGMDVSYKSPQIIWTGTIIWCNISSISVRVYGMVDGGEKNSDVESPAKEKLALNDFYIYEVPHLFLIAEIKTVFFGIRCQKSLDTFPQKRRWLEPSTWGHQMHRYTSSHRTNPMKCKPQEERSIKSVLQR